VLRFQLLVFLCQTRLFDREEQNADRDKHDCRDDQEKRLIVQPVRFGQPHGVQPLLRVQNGGDCEIQNAADGTHEVDDGVGARAKRLRREIRH